MQKGYPEDKVIYGATSEETDAAPLGKYGQRLASSATPEMLAQTNQQTTDAIAADLLKQIGSLRKSK